ncbi:MAG: hypothetical protein ACUZ77_07970 [Candidatus Brocadiales bacterium]
MTFETDAIIEKKLRVLEEVLKEVSDVLTLEEIGIIRNKAEALLYCDPLINGIRGMINKIIGQKETSDIKEKTKQIQNHLSELNLAYLFSKEKNFAIGIERNNRKNSKKVDITIYNKRNYYVELKNVNEPEYARRETLFCNEVSKKLATIKKPYFVNFNFFHHRRLECPNALIEFIKETAENEETEKCHYFHDEDVPMLFFAFKEDPNLTHLELGLYGYGEGKLSNFKKNEFLNNQLAELERKITENRLSGKPTSMFEYQLEKYKLLKDNKNLRSALFIKESLIRHIKDTEEKFLNTEPDSLNILAIPLGLWGQPYLVEDLQSWYSYNQPPEGHSDPLFRLYDFYARDIGFKKRRNINAFVALEGRGLVDKYKISFFTKNVNDIKALENIFV